ncbi:MAG: hypothetical protein LW875_04610 [Proteobacteria bacterium]|jgi:hypothetical protein|nr:hypothetical protein [Pseudomonadota bacterium]
MKKWTPIIALAISFQLMTTSCAFGPSENEAEKEELKDIEQLKNTYSAIQGEYKGEIVGNGRTIPVMAWLYWVLEPSTANSKGEKTFIPSLRMRYRQLDVIQRDQIGAVRFVSSSGDFLGTVSSTSAVTHFSGSLNQSNLNLTVVKNEGTLGRMTARRISADIQATSKNLEEDFFDRLKLAHQRVVGLYEGHVKPASGSVYPIQIEIKSFQRVSESGSLTLLLKAVYRRLDFPDPTVSERLMDASVRFELFPIEISLSSEGSASAIPNSYFLAIRGNLDEVSGVYKGEIFDRRGSQGRFEVLRKSN